MILAWAAQAVYDTCMIILVTILFWRTRRPR
jgi:hypothetical protein